MEKQPKTKGEIERMIIAEMKTFANCENALGVIVVAIGGDTHTATWTVSRFNAGRSDGNACDGALQVIIPRFQRAYDLVQMHSNSHTFLIMITDDGAR
jgi:hypothetical protein